MDWDAFGDDAPPTRKPDWMADDQVLVTVDCRVQVPCKICTMTVQIGEILQGLADGSWRHLRCVDDLRRRP